MEALILLAFTLSIPLENKTSAWFNFGHGFNITTIFLLLSILVWLVSKKSKESLFIKNPLNLPILAFMLIMYLSLWTAYVKFEVSPFGSELHFFKRFVTTFILFFIIANSVKDKKTMRLLISGMILMLFLIVLVTFREYRGEYRWHYSNSIRFFVAGMQPNHLGAFFAQSIPILFSLVFLHDKFRNKVFYLILLTLSLPALMFTYSRGAYVAIIVAILVMTFLGGRRVFLRVVPIMLIAMVAISFLFGKGRIIPVSVKERFTSISEEDKSIQGRREAWQVAKEYIVQSPIVGYGYGASKRLLPRDTHNMYLDIILEAGILALLLLLWIFFRAFKTAYKLYRTSEDPFYKAIALGAIGSLAAVVIGNLFGTRLNLFASNGYFAILLGMVVRAKFEEDRALATNTAVARNNSAKKRYV